MNFRHWFGRSKRDEDEELERMRRTVAALPKPRAQHYAFAHRLLPAIARDMGALCVMTLADSDRRDSFLHDLWRDCGQNETGRDLVAPDGLRARVARSGDKLIALITLPRPELTTEAHFVAIMTDLPPETDDEDADSPPEARQILQLLLRSMPVRYFTLEKTVAPKNAPPGCGPRTAFCEWTSEQRHLNMGDGPAPDEDLFFRFLAAQNFPSVRASFDPNRPRPVQDGA